MKCVICEKPLYDKFNHNFIISFCDSCKLEHAKFEIFKDILLETLINDKAYKYIKDSIKRIMIDNLQKNFLHEQFGLICKVKSCSLNKSCDGSVSTGKRGACYIYQYDYHGFKFYYCYYQKLIIYNAADIDILLQYLYKVAKKTRFKLKINKILQKIKDIFIKEEGIKEDVKK